MPPGGGTYSPEPFSVMSNVPCTMPETFRCAVPVVSTPPPDGTEGAPVGNPEGSDVGMPDGSEVGSDGRLVGRCVGSSVGGVLPAVPSGFADFCAAAAGRGGA